MAFLNLRSGKGLGIPVASTIPPRSLVKLSASGFALLAAASANQRPLGMTGEATGAQGAPIPVYDDGNIVKAIAGASLGAGCEVVQATYGVASAAQRNTLATVAQFGPITVASGTKQWAVGFACDNAGAGDVFSLYIKPRLTGQTLDA